MSDQVIVREIGGLCPHDLNQLALLGTHRGGLVGRIDGALVFIFDDPIEADLFASQAAHYGKAEICSN